SPILRRDCADQCLRRALLASLLLRCRAGSIAPNPNGLARVRERYSLRLSAQELTKAPEKRLQHPPAPSDAHPETAAPFHRCGYRPRSVNRLRRESSSASISLRRSLLPAHESRRNEDRS